MRRIIVSLPDKEPKEGVFHEWGSCEKGPFAVVEYPDGTIEVPFVQFVRFPEPDPIRPQDTSIFDLVFGK